MVHPETLQQSQYNPQNWGYLNTQYGQPTGAYGLGQNFGPGNFGLGLGQAAYGQQWGQFGNQPFGQQSFGGFNVGAPWNIQSRQLSQHEVGDVVRQLVPLLPQLIAQAQTQPQAAYGYGGFGSNLGLNLGFNPWGQQGRQLTQQDVHEVVRQILPLMPQIAGALQGQAPYFGQGNQYGQYGLGGIGQAFAGQQNPFGGQAFGQPYMAAFGSGQRPLSQQDASEIARQLVAVIPHVITSLQSNQQFGQQRAI
jgi:hypothetical protein